ncbi:MAG: PHP domain-containing protein [Candidatus Thermoplasmatota archaeon]
MRHVDLHAHTTASDGTLAPTALVEAAKAAGLVALAVTDHDSLGALEEARIAGTRLGVEIVPGVELSVTHAVGDVHILGYFVDDHDARLVARLTHLREARERRAGAIVEKLRELGVDITLADVEREAEKGSALGRPHVARALLTRGHVASVQDAFDRFLADGRPAAVPKAKLSAQEAIILIHGAGGVAVLAHPGILADDARERVVRELAKMGLDAVEVLHPKNTPEVRVKLREWADELGLVQTGGSDYHGENKPGIEIGAEPVSYEALNALRRRAATARRRLRG